jgi:hypothetical protein
MSDTGGRARSYSRGPSTAQIRYGRKLPSRDLFITNIPATAGGTVAGHNIPTHRSNARNQVSERLVSWGDHTRKPKRFCNKCLEDITAWPCIHSNKQARLQFSTSLQRCIRLVTRWRRGIGPRKPLLRRRAEIQEAWRAYHSFGCTFRTHREAYKM